MNPEETLHRCSYNMLFRKYTANLHKNIHVKVRFSESCKATLLKSHFGMSALP